MHHVLGNTIAKLANGITDTPALMAAKSHLRNNNPIVIALSTNDGLSGNAENIGKLLNRNNYFFVPFKQDNPITKPRSLVADFSYLIPTIEKALDREQIVPILVWYISNCIYVDERLFICVTWGTHLNVSQLLHGL